MSYLDIAFVVLVVLVGALGSILIIISARNILEEDKKCAT